MNSEFWVELAEKWVEESHGFIPKIQDEDDVPDDVINSDILEDVLSDLDLDDFGI